MEPPEKTFHQADKQNHTNIVVEEDQFLTLRHAEPDLHHREDSVQNCKPAKEGQLVVFSAREKAMFVSHEDGAIHSCIRIVATIGEHKHVNPTLLQLIFPC